jgi:hypothetical protein
MITPALVSASGCDGITHVQKTNTMIQANHAQTQASVLSASIDAIEAESGSRVVRVILTIEPTAEKEVRNVLRRVGVTEIDRIDGQPLIGTTATPQQLRSLIGGGHVLSLTRDIASPSH